MRRSPSRVVLTARPQPSGVRQKPGLHALLLNRTRDALLYVPEKLADAADPVPLALSLHGAGGNEKHGIELLRRQADEFGFVLLSPASRQQSWDVIVNDFGPDVQFINTALERTFQMCDIDPARVAVGGCGSRRARSARSW